MSKKIVIDIESHIPKYKQISISIAELIRDEEFKIGQKIPSINEMSEKTFVARETVEKAYKLLKKQNLIFSEIGKGYYVSQ